MYSLLKIAATVASMAITSSQSYANQNNTLEGVFFEESSYINGAYKPAVYSIYEGGSVKIAHPPMLEDGYDGLLFIPELNEFKDYGIVYSITGNDVEISIQDGASVIAKIEGDCIIPQVEGLHKSCKVSEVFGVMISYRRESPPYQRLPPYSP